jgi:hypothetical protein
MNNDVIKNRKVFYKYTLEEDKEYPFLLNKDINFKGYDRFKQLLVSICAGSVTVKAGYSWDGCSVKVAQIGPVYIGTPDGFKNQTKYASLIHDVLYQFNKEINAENNNLLEREEVDYIFYDQLKKVGWPFARIYYFAVRKLGKKFWNN